MTFLTIFSSLILSLSAVLTTCEIDCHNGTTNFTFPTSCLKFDEMKMKFESTVTGTFVIELENEGQFLRDTATVTIVQG